MGVPSKSLEVVLLARTECVFHLLYCSRSLLSPRQVRTDMKAILNSARRNNAARNVTGVLTLHRDKFVQMLEGQQTDVMEIFSRIERDQRHTDLMMLRSGPSDSRVFADWHMSLIGDEGEADIPLLATENTLALANLPKMSAPQRQALDAIREIART